MNSLVIHYFIAVTVLWTGLVSANTELTGCPLESVAPAVFNMSQLYYGLPAKFQWFFSPCHRSAPSNNNKFGQCMGANPGEAPTYLNQYQPAGSTTGNLAQCINSEDHLLLSWKTVSLTNERESSDEVSSSSHAFQAQFSTGELAVTPYIAKITMQCALGKPSLNLGPAGSATPWKKERIQGASGFSSSLVLESGKFCPHPEETGWKSLPSRSERLTNAAVFSSVVILGPFLVSLGGCKNVKLGCSDEEGSLSDQITFFHPDSGRTVLAVTPDGEPAKLDWPIGGSQNFATVFGNSIYIFASCGSAAKEAQKKQWIQRITWVDVESGSPFIPDEHIKVMVEGNFSRIDLGAIGNLFSPSLNAVCFSINSTVVWITGGSNAQGNPTSPFYYTQVVLGADGSGDVSAEARLQTVAPEVDITLAGSSGGGGTVTSGGVILAIRTEQSPPYYNDTWAISVAKAEYAEHGSKHNAQYITEWTPFEQHWIFDQSIPPQVVSVGNKMILASAGAKTMQFRQKGWRRFWFPFEIRTSTRDRASGGETGFEGGTLVALPINGSARLYNFGGTEGSGGDAGRQISSVSIEFGDCCLSGSIARAHNNISRLLSTEEWRPVGERIVTWNDEVDITISPTQDRVRSLWKSCLSSSGAGGEKCLLRLAADPNCRMQLLPDGDITIDESLLLSNKTSKSLNAWTIRQQLPTYYDLNGSAFTDDNETSLTGSTKARRGDPRLKFFVYACVSLADDQSEFYHGTYRETFKPLFSARDFINLNPLQPLLLINSSSPPTLPPTTTAIPPKPTPSTTAPTQAPPITVTKPFQLTKMQWIAVGVGGGALVLAIVALSIFCCRRLKTKSKEEAQLKKTNQYLLGIAATNGALDPNKCIGKDDDADGSVEKASNVAALGDASRSNTASSSRGSEIVGAERRKQRGKKATTRATESTKLSDLGTLDRMANSQGHIQIDEESRSRSSGATTAPTFSSGAPDGEEADMETAATRTVASGTSRATLRRQE